MFLLWYDTSKMSQKIGEQLRQRREALEITLEEATRATHIRLHYLQALEAGNLDVLASDVQRRGFTRAYASYLGLDAEALLFETQPAESFAETEQTTLEEALTAAPVEAAEDGSAPVAQPADVIFTEIGEKLRHQRELLGFSREDVEKHTRLRAYYLLALEQGKLDELPSPVQGRGMLSNYASFLGLDPEPLLLRYADGLQARLAVKQASRPEPRTRSVTRPSQRRLSVRRIFSAELIIGSILVLFLVAAFTWAAIRIFAMRSEEQPSPTAPSIAEILLATATETLTPTPMTATPTPPAAVLPPIQVQTTGTPESQDALLSAAGSGVQVYVTVRNRGWMRALVDGEIEYEGRVLQGSAFAFAGDERVEILTGDGSALQVFFNQQDLGPLGLSGQVVNLVFTLDGIQTPTPTVTLTPTETPRVSATPTQTAAP